MGIILHELLAHLPTDNTQKKISNIASDEDIMANNYISYVMEFKGHQSLDFPTMLFFLLLAQNLKITEEVM